MESTDKLKSMHSIFHYAHFPWMLLKSLQMLAFWWREQRVCTKVSLSSVFHGHFEGTSVRAVCCPCLWVEQGPLKFVLLSLHTSFLDPKAACLTPTTVLRVNGDTFALENSHGLSVPLGLNHSYVFMSFCHGLISFAILYGVEVEILMVACRTLWDLPRLACQPPFMFCPR